ncbi:hypothetical protein P9112_003114 [Eukaryota sp. TZLM1-RC]
MTVPNEDLETLQTIAKLLELSPTFREDSNHLIHTLYSRQDFESCLSIIDDVLTKTNGLCEYAVYIKGLIFRHQGKINESLQLFHVATFLNPHSVRNIKQVGKSLHLLGKHKAAIEVFHEAYNLGIDDWEIWYCIGVCQLYLKLFEKAIESLRNSINHEPHDCAFSQLGRCYTLTGQFSLAVKVYQEALDFSPDNPKILTTLGLLCLRMDDLPKAFDFLGNALTIDPRDSKAILAAGSMIQDSSDNDVALVKYRLAVKQMPTSAQLWNNIGMCFFGKNDLLASVACLKKATQYGPFEWIIPFNLALVYMNCEQYASAFHYLSTCLNLKPDFHTAFTYLGVVLGKLNDFDNCIAAYERSLELKDDWTTRLNFCASLINFARLEEAREQFEIFEGIYAELSKEERNEDEDAVALRSKIKSILL